MRPTFITLIFGLLLFLLYGNAFSQDSDLSLDELDLDFEIKELEKKPYSINADIETEETILFYNHDALLFKQKYLNSRQEDAAWQTDFSLTIEGQFEWNIVKLYGRFNSLLYYNDDEDWVSDRKAEELYLSFQPSYSCAVDAGKRVHKWGKGYAFSPAALFARPKNLDDPDATLEGYYTLSADFIKSYEGIVKTIAITPVLMPVNKDINDEIGANEEVVWGGKLYLFTLDTDIDLMFMISDNMDNHLGIDFSKNISASFEIHGDAAVVQNYTKHIIDEYGNISSYEYTAFNLLLGVRYLSDQDTTYILEYFHNGEGYSPEEYDNYLTFINSGFENYLSSSSRAAILKSKTMAAYYNQQAAMKDYIYLKISQKEPFDILYFTPGITFIYNLNDQSGNITPYFTYSPVTNLTLELKAGLLFGESNTEYNEKISSGKIVISIQYYF